ncbi:MAG: ABC transporter permease subunit [Armatimonas sp.]
MSELYLLRESLRSAFAPKRLVMVLVLVLLPAIIGLFYRFTQSSERFDPVANYNSLALNIVFRLILTLLAVLYGTGALSQEIDGRTIVYLLTRPMARWRILLTKLVGAWLLVALAGCLSVFMLALALFGGQISQAPLALDIRAIVIGAAAYSALFCFLSTLLSRPLLYALLYGVGWENVASLFPGGFARLSILSNLQTLSAHLKDVPANEGADSPLNSLLIGDPTIITRPQAWIAIWLAILGWGLLSLITFSKREYAPREEGG